jgi:hypothetical protein
LTLSLSPLLFLKVISILFDSTQAEGGGSGGKVLQVAKQTQESILEKMEINLKAEDNEKIQLKQKVADLEAKYCTLQR